jgi:hypothetical protein
VATLAVPKSLLRSPQKNPVGVKAARRSNK